MKLFIVALKTPWHPQMPQFARDAVECSQKYSGCEVLAITNHSEPGWISDSVYFETANRMTLHCDSKHLKDGVAWNNMTPMQRWAIIWDYIKTHNISEPIFSCDWDLMVCGDVQKHLDKFDYKKFDLCDLYAKEAKPPIDHLAPYCVVNLDAIGFLCETFISRLKFRCPSLLHGFGSDMGWWSVVKQLGGYSHVDVGQERDDCVIDNNIVCNRDVYEEAEGNKVVKIIDGVPHFIRRSDQKPIRAIAVHCFMAWKQRTHELLGRTHQ